MRLARIQRRAKNRMKLSTDQLCKDEISAARFIATYYANFLLGMGVAVLGYKRGSVD